MLEGGAQVSLLPLLLSPSGLVKSRVPRVSCPSYLREPLLRLIHVCAFCQQSDPVSALKLKVLVCREENGAKGTPMAPRGTLTSRTGWGLLAHGRGAVLWLSGLSLVPKKPFQTFPLQEP